MQLRTLMTVLPRTASQPQRAQIAYANAVIEDMPVSQVRQVLGWMIDAAPDYAGAGAEVNATKLAEDACFTFSLYAGDDIPESLFELAGAVALAYADEQK